MEGRLEVGRRRLKLVVEAPDGESFTLEESTWAGEVAGYEGGGP